MRENDSIVIEAVENGFLVTTWYDPSYKNSQLSGERKVFQSMSELALFIKNHFSHRNREIAADQTVEEDHL
jgi:hypothetical protein